MTLITLGIWALIAYLSYRNYRASKTTTQAAWHAAIFWIATTCLVVILI